jgi:hypothetical protein
VNWPAVSTAKNRSCAASREPQPRTAIERTSSALHITATYAISLRDIHRESLLRQVIPKLDVETNGFAWTPDRKALWQRIQHHNFEPDTQLNFTQRLARDHGWNLREARSYIDAYRKFCFLAVFSPTPVTPSEIVDEVWHQHLIYSRDYWAVWCGEVLQEPLHHDPIPGGLDAQKTYRRQYAETLSLYEQAFGTPDSEIWPATHLRFKHPRYSTIDRERWFILPKPTAWFRKKIRR